MAAWFLAASLAAVVLTPVPVAAQPAVPTAAPPASASAPAARYRSAFEGHARTADPKVVPWREANDLVGRIGGWKAYAREAQGPGRPAGNSHQEHRP